MKKQHFDVPPSMDFARFAGYDDVGMTTFQIAGYLTEFADGRAEIRLEGAPGNVGEALKQLWNEHSGLRDRVLTEQGQVRQHVNVFLNNQVMQRDRVLDTPMSGDNEICIMPAVSGGEFSELCPD